MKHQRFSWPVGLYVTLFNILFDMVFRYASSWNVLVVSIRREGASLVWLVGFHGKGRQRPGCFITFFVFRKRTPNPYPTFLYPRIVIGQSSFWRCDLLVALCVFMPVNCGCLRFFPWLIGLVLGCLRAFVLWCNNPDNTQLVHWYGPKRHLLQQARWCSPPPSDSGTMKLNKLNIHRSWRRRCFESLFPRYSFHILSKFSVSMCKSRYSYIYTVYCICHLSILYMF